MSVVDLNLEAGKETVAIYVDERGNAIYNITVHQTTCSHLLHNALHSCGLTVRCDCMVLAHWSTHSFHFQCVHVHETYTKVVDITFYMNYCR